MDKTKGFCRKHGLSHIMHNRDPTILRNRLKKVVKIAYQEETTTTLYGKIIKTTHEMYQNKTGQWVTRETGLPLKKTHRNHLSAIRIVMIIYYHNKERLFLPSLNEAIEPVFLYDRTQR